MLESTSVKVAERNVLQSLFVCHILHDVSVGLLTECKGLWFVVFIMT